ncbi:hypothetical protein BU23DRAFT_565535 [Bimuria novae-zelandiae CBS 107.79]|uniref:Uncharacterized protein n=1 Tax=Bimuria novae-zelandiae CBS 107.79 TaxID=1447943 RepID=A0A6A5VIP6_9PLEO|nr:hypothetical protein BU23DRAFT_565535 [Bimuria novae-zelandiae CBS 107.79]
MFDSAAPPDESQQHEAPRNIRRYFGGQQQMSEGSTVDTPSINDVEHMSSPVESRVHEESSDEDDVPLCDRRQRDLRQKTMSTSFKKPDQGSPVSIGKNHLHKRPGPKPYAAKPIAKNDMKAKMEVIRAIEKNWGKNFIINYIPKCHRPLQKKRGGKRTAYRQHEIDPKNWLPSILKSILMISELTDDKVFLKKAFNDIVRHRIKHTGNRKPQLVTTDLDIIEDMLTRGWDIETSFSIRYKHLLLAQPKGYLETDEDIDHILACGDDDYPQVSDHEDEEQNDGDEMEADAEDDDDSLDLSSPYKQKNTYIHGSPHQPPKKIKPKSSKLSKPIKKGKQDTPTKAPKRSKLPARQSVPPSPQQMPQHPYSAYSMPGYPPYGGYSGYPPMPGYPPQQHMKGYPPMPPHMKNYPPPPMYPWPAYGQYPSYGQQDPNDKDADAQDPRVQEPRAQPHGYPPQGYPPHGFPPHGYPPMPPYGHPMSPSPTLSRSTPAPSNTSGGMAHRDRDRARFSSFTSHRARSSSVRPEGPARYDASGIPVAPRIKREPGVKERPIAVEEFEDADMPSNDLGPSAEDEDTGNRAGDGEVDDDVAEALKVQEEICAQEKKVEALKAKLASTKGGR